MSREPGKKNPPLNQLAVVLVSTRNPLNIGAAARAMSNFGFSDLRTVNPFELAFREAQSAVGAAEVLANARVHTAVAEAVSDCSLVVGTTAARNRHFEHELKSLPQAGPLIRAAMNSGRVALLFGSEKRGLSKQDLSYCHWVLRIPTVERAPAMNLGQAVALCLYELARERNAPAKSTTPDIVTAHELERVASVLIEVLTTSGYLKGPGGAAENDKIRRLLRRLRLSPQDSQTLLGMLRQTLWKMRLSG